MIKTGADVGGMHKANAGIDSKRLLHQMSLCSKQRVRAEKGDGLGVPWGDRNSQQAVCCMASSNVTLQCWPIRGDRNNKLKLV